MKVCEILQNVGKCDARLFVDFARQRVFFFSSFLWIMNNVCFEGFFYCVENFHEFIESSSCRVFAVPI